MGVIIEYSVLNHKNIINYTKMIADATARKPNKSWSASSTIQFKKRNVQTPTNRNTTINK